MATAFQDELAAFHRDNRTLFLSEEEVFESCGVLFDTGAWTPTKIRPREWLDNFDEVERPYALLLLSKFNFFADHLTDELFLASVHKIAEVTRSEGTLFPVASIDWNYFCASVVITLVRDENPNPADSGHLFARKARQVLGFEEDSLVSEQQAVSTYVQGSQRPLVFVDDFVGSGNQFIETWNRPYEVAGQQISFHDLHNAGQLADTYYCNALATEEGLDAIRTMCPGVRVLSGNVVTPEFSFVDDRSHRWPEPLRALGVRFIERLNNRYGYTDEDGGQEDWRGYHKLGLGVSFAHGTPDATLPIFRSERNGWRWLVRMA